MGKRKLFCEINDTCYQISLTKEALIRDVKDIFKGEKYAKKRNTELLPNIVKGHRSILVRKLHGVDIRLQENKVTNIALACKKISGLVIHPGETFSFWKTLGKTTEKQGYKDGLVVTKKGFKAGAGGGICQMANMIHWLILNSPLKVTEMHHHSDALFPDDQRRVPFGTGTSVAYKNVDYRFKNTTNQDVQLLVWIDDNDLCGELRSETPFPYIYKIVEENHHFEKEEKDYYRISQVYRIIMDRETKETIKKELILNNHSKVMYDHNLIPKDQILEKTIC